MKLLIISALVLLTLPSVVLTSYASCRDNTGPQGNYEICSGRP